MMETQLYLRVRGRVLGPYDEEKLQTLVRRGQLSRMHEVSSDGTHWVRASTYGELFVGAPVKLAVPEMQVASPPPAQLPVDSSAIPFAEEVAAPAPESSRPVIPAVTSPGWYYESLGSEHGPVDESALRQMLLTGQLGSNALVWKDGMPQWVAASQIPCLVPMPALNRAARDGVDRSPAEDGMEDLCKAAQASRPWALFLAITAFVYAGLCILFGFLMLVHGADKGFPPVVAMGLFWMISGAVTAAGGILLSNYANRLASLTYGHSAKVLESAMDRLKTFWMFVSIVLIVTLAFIGFFTIWILAIGASLARYM
jgi:hypothetical protein